MDQSLKARLIGATVLVVIAVLLIPELLTGRKLSAPTAEAPAARDTRTFTIELGRSGGTMSNPTPAPASSAPDPAPTPARSASAAASPDLAPQGPGGIAPVPDDAPAPAGPAMPGATQPDRTPSAATEPVVAAPTPVAVQPVEPVQDTVPAAAPAEGGAFLVQVGAFGSADAARKLVAELRSAGYSAEVAPITRNGKTLHRVRVGPASGRAAARQVAGRLQARGLPASVVESD